MIHSPLLVETARRKVEKEPIWIPDHVWDRYLDPIDKEIYTLLKERYPYAYSETGLLKKLVELDPEENADYRIQDIWDSFNYSLKDYVVRKGRHCWALKGERPKSNI